jgi:hypothetical protein
MKIVQKWSPNQSERIHGDAAVRLIVCHTPEGSYQGTINYICDPNAARKVSYHMLIKKDGTEATQLVPFDRKAWHAGAINSLSDGIAIEDYAKNFSLLDNGVREMAKVVARRLYTRKLPAQWTTDPAKGGFCRHGDLQTDRSDPTPDLAEWKIFVGMVQDEYANLKALDKPWPIPIPAGFWKWMIWLNTGKTTPRPTGALKDGLMPMMAPLWAWRRRAAWLAAKRV